MRLRHILSKLITVVVVWARWALYRRNLHTYQISIEVDAKLLLLECRMYLIDMQRHSTRDLILVRGRLAALTSHSKLCVSYFLS